MDANTKKMLTYGAVAAGAYLLYKKFVAAPDAAATPTSPAVAAKAAAIASSPASAGLMSGQLTPPTDPFASSGPITDPSQVSGVGGLGSLGGTVFR